MGLAGLLCPNWRTSPHPLGLYKVGDWDKTFPQKVMVSVQSSELIRCCSKRCEGTNRPHTGHCPFARAQSQTVRGADMGLSWGFFYSLTGVLRWTHHCLFKAGVAGKRNTQCRDPQLSLPFCSYCRPWVSNSPCAELHLAWLLCRYFNYADMFLDSFKYVYYLLIRP